MLIRAVGPGLAQYGVTGTVSTTALSVVDSKGNTVSQNSGWSTSPDAVAITLAATQVGAFALTPGSGDSALITSLNPGSYTAVVNGAGNAGNALVELYLLP